MKYECTMWIFTLEKEKDGETDRELVGDVFHGLPRDDNGTSFSILRTEDISINLPSGYYL